ncbi:unnamed protein product [Heterosigma akashiwo]|mmetsp:Transcript_1387/g.2000  ORF Transcript_1387/g.2000 Transcript_1387/m.2000 type:complete len:102 (-) Transcript_1387:238-543(-)
MGACSLFCCSRCCTFFSIFGIFFLLMFGLLFDRQGYYILGYEDDNISDYASGCYGAAGIYAVFLVLSILGWVYDNRQKSQQNSALLEKNSIVTNKGHVGYT